MIDLEGRSAAGEAPAVDLEGLNGRQIEFIKEYVAGEHAGNATRAYKKVYNADQTDESAAASASFILTNPKVRAAIKALHDAETPVAGDVLIAAVADEEYASMGTADIAKRYPVDAAIVTEPTELDLCLAHKGFVWMEVETQGRAAHGSRFEEGVDANMHMGRVMAALDVLEQDFRTREGHPLTGPPSLHLSRTILKDIKQMNKEIDQMVAEAEQD